MVPFAAGPPRDELVVVATSPELASAAAAAIAADLRRAVADRGAASLVLAGGSTPRPVYELLAAAELPWDRIELFFGDERCVPPDHDDSNFAMVETCLLRALPGPPPAVHRIRGELGPRAAARAYDQVLRKHCEARGGWDVVLLGLGEDGHTASLFPAALPTEDGRLAAEGRAPVVPHERVTFTLRGLASCRQVVFLARGASKLPALRSVLASSPAQSGVPPAALVAGRRRWFVDLAALTGVS
ncbi:MAG: 6-phosphogluconolactonase [Acidobacteriota bacterium]